MLACLMVAAAFAGLILLREEKVKGHPAFETWKMKYSVKYDNPLEN